MPTGEVRRRTSHRPNATPPTLTTVVAMEEKIRRAVDQTFERFQYQLSHLEITRLCVAWATIWAMNTSPRYRDKCPAPLKFEQIRNAAAGRGDLMLTLLTAAIFDLQTETDQDGGVALHIGLASKPNDILALLRIWERLPEYEGDGLGAVYMAAVHR